ncbi:hypothetical protein [Dialister hominis]|uniref:hypothetical protein n=1 Tax=Dialister hominis TaxID=2582419 RepID=UPI003FED7BBB
MVNGSQLGWEPFASFYEAIGCKRIKFDSHIVFGEDLLFRFQFTKGNKGLYIYQYLPKYHYFTRMDSAVNSYAIYRKVDDLKVLERVMIETSIRTKRLLLYKEYVPRLVRYYILGIQSSDYRDVVVVRDIRRKIKRNIRLFLKDNVICAFMKLGLIVFLFPQSMARNLWRLYQGCKKLV